MIKHCALFFLFLLTALLQADTLTLRNGTVVTGSWIGVDADRIKFMVNDEVKTYQRLDVVSVTFGSGASSAPSTQDAVPAPQPTGTVVPRSSSQPTSQPLRRSSQRSAPSMERPQKQVVVEPDAIGDVYTLNAGGELAPLENSLSQLRRPRNTSPVPSAPHVYWDIPNSKSSVRFEVGRQLQFVVRLERGVSPDNFKLYLMTVTKDSRRVMADARGQAPPERFFMDVAKYGETSYTLTPTQLLSVGEYCFSPSTSDRVSCFGVDPSR